MRLRITVVAAGLAAAALHACSSDDDAGVDVMAPDAGVDGTTRDASGVDVQGIDAHGATDAPPPVDAEVGADGDAGMDADAAADADADVSLCGNGVIDGDELCDDGDAGVGCTDGCVFDPGYTCDDAGAPCRPTTCNDGKREGSEACDDGNSNLGDHCTPTCQAEPECPVAGGPCTSVCGDGIKVPGEGCDDGNRHDGDGCSRHCTVEPGWTCGPRTTPAPSLVLPLVLRDFKMGWNIADNGGAQSPQPGGHADFENNALSKGLEVGIVKNALGADGKPEYVKGLGGGGTKTTTGKEYFDQWYRDVANLNLTVLQSLTLTLTGAGPIYVVDSANYFPLNGLGFGNQGAANNFSFTTETRFWFQYQGGETITLGGDDDIWLYVNKKLVIDLGGVHGATQPPAVAMDSLGLTAGSIYEVSLFAAERHTYSSSLHLELKGFRDATSVCAH